MVPLMCRGPALGRAQRSLGQARQDKGIRGRQSQADRPPLGHHRSFEVLLHFITVKTFEVARTGWSSCPA